jgi:hypothetical protein
MKVTIRSAKPRSVKGSPSVDHEAMSRDLHGQLEPLLQQRFGERLELKLE